MTVVDALVHQVKGGVRLHFLSTDIKNVRCVCLVKPNSFATKTLHPLRAYVGLMTNSKAPTKLDGGASQLSTPVHYLVNVPVAPKSKDGSNSER